MRYMAIVHLLEDPDVSLETLYFDFETADKVQTFVERALQRGININLGSGIKRSYPAHQISFIDWGKIPNDG